MKSGELLRDLHIYFNDIEDLEKKEREINSFISSLEAFKNQVHNEKIGITDENLEEKIKEFLDNNYRWLKKDKNGYYIWEYDKCEYDDRLTENDIKKILEGKTKEEREDIFCELLYEDCFLDFENNVMSDIANNFRSEYNYFQHDTEIQDILVNLMYFSYDTYLKDEYNVNIIIDFDKQDYNTEFSNSSNLENCKNNNLYTLLKKQGYSKKDYENNLKFLKDNKNEIERDKFGNYDYKKIEELGGNKFLTSVKEEINNNYYDNLTGLVVLKKMSLEDLINLDKITINAKNDIGLFNWCYGSGSLLEIQLEKDFVLDRENDIYYIQVEGSKQDFGYSVNEVFGLVGSCWKE